MFHLAQNIRLVRLVSGKTQTEFGRQFQASKAMIVSYEKGKANPDELFISRLSKYSGVSEKDLLNKQLHEADIKKQLEKVEKEDLPTLSGKSKQKTSGYVDLSLTNLTQSNKVLAEANRTLAEANKTLAEANHVISKNHDELIQLTKMIVSNSAVLSKTPAATFGPEGNKVSQGFGEIPSGSQKKTEKPKGKH